MEMPSNVRIFEDKTFVYVDSPVAKGWHSCKSTKEVTPYFPVYKGEYDNDSLKWVGKRIPQELILEFAGLCKEFPKTEVKALLFYSTKENDWHMYIPEQKSSAASVDYDAKEYDAPESYYLMGSIHTHPEMGAFWSGTDLSDIKDKDGIHIVFALRDGICVDYKCSLFKGGVEYPCKDHIELPAKDADLPVPSEEIKNRIKPTVFSNVFIGEDSIWTWQKNTEAALESWRQRHPCMQQADFPGFFEACADDTSDSESLSDAEIEMEAAEISADLTKAEAFRLCASILSEFGEDELADYIESHLDAEEYLIEGLDDSLYPEDYYEGVATEFLEKEKENNDGCK